MKEQWKGTAVVILVAALVGYVLGQAGLIPDASAQSSSSSQEVAVVMGPEAVDDDVPFLVVDSMERTIMVYEWDMSARTMKFQAARNYEYDRMVENYGQSKNTPSVEDVEGRVQGN
ncbi:MAG: hypothetical protein ACLFT2_03640 [Candidatus Brocadiia bacterium]